MITPISWRRGLWLCGVLMLAGVTSGGVAAERAQGRGREAASVVTEAAIVVQSLEFPGGLPVRLQSAEGARSGFMPTAEAENLCRLMALDRAVYMGTPQWVSLRTDRPTHVVGALDRQLGESEEQKKIGSTIMVNGQPFTTRNVGVEAELVLQDYGAGQARVNALINTTVFKGFVEYGGVQVRLGPDDEKVSNRPVITVPKGFYQPIFETQSREEKLALESGRTTWVLVMLPKSEIPMGPFWSSVDQGLGRAFIPKGGLYREGAPDRAVLFLFRLEAGSGE